MDRATEEEADFREESRQAKTLTYGRQQWKQRRGFLRKNRRLLAQQHISANGTTNGCGASKSRYSICQRAKRCAVE